MSVFSNRFTAPEPSFAIGDRVVGYHKGRVYRGKVISLGWANNRMAIEDDNNGGKLAKLRTTYCAKERDTTTDALYFRGDRVMVAPDGWNKRYRVEGYVSDYNLADHTVMVIEDRNHYDAAHPPKRGPYPINCVHYHPRAWDEPIIPKDWRFSIRKDEDHWVLTAWHGEHCNEYTEETAEDILGLAEEVPTLPLCHWCAAPLWESGGHVVCSRHWDHYPQPNLEQYQERQAYKHGWRSEPPQVRLPVVKPSHNSYGCSNNHAKLTAWAKKHLAIEATDTKDEQGKRHIFATYAVKPDTERERKAKMRAAEKGEIEDEYKLVRCMAEFRQRENISANGNGKMHAYPDPIMGLYETYRVTVQAAGIAPRGYAAWCEHRWEVLRSRRAVAC